ncbi:cation:proton antiporter [Rhodoferax sp. GW822-FHT02A01]|uniref:cation:proton antiporter n=1 Tax=Rhodoferax sp. GW822-FHT02A01 TaxID=3141537 RepID=UPI00315CE4A5
MNQLVPLLMDAAWPITILVAWLAGEYGYQLAKLPRLSAYALIGFLLAPGQLGLLPQTQSGMVLLIATMAFSLILFECGYRINLRWLLVNPWIAVSSLAESGLCFAAVYFVLTAYEQPMTNALLLSALAMASSPATMVRVITESRSSGQATERLLHLSTMNTVLAVFVFKIILGWAVLQTSGNIWKAAYNSLVVLAASVLLGLLAGMLAPVLLRITKRASQDSTLAFTIVLLCLVALTYGMRLSPVLAALTYGVHARHRRMVLNSSQRGFGALGELFSILLFVFISSRLTWPQVVAGASLGLAFILARQCAKILGIGLFSHASGIHWRKGLLIGLACAPTPAFVILVLEQTNSLSSKMVDQLIPLATATLALEILGPILVQWSLAWAHETPKP